MNLSESTMDHSTKKRKYSESIYSIPKEIQNLAQVGIQRCLSRLGLSLGDDIIPVLGSRPLETNSTLMYEKHLRGLKYFFSLIGDYESLLIMLPRPPTRVCPSMDPKSISLFIKYKRGKKGTQLLDSNDDEVHDVLGNPVLCVGQWNTPKNHSQLLSAIGAVHAAKGNDGEYREACDECIAGCDAGEYQGCFAHVGSIRVWRGGNPKNCDLMRNTVKRSTKDSSNYVEHGNHMFFLILNSKLFIFSH